MHRRVRKKNLRLDPSRIREMKEMNSRQAKISVETMKEVQNDKTLKTKGEKDRRLREKKQNNTKKFMDERKMALMKHNKEKEKLKAKHDKESEALNKDIQNVSHSVKLFFLLGLFHLKPFSKIIICNTHN